MRQEEYVCVGHLESPSGQREQKKEKKKREFIHFYALDVLFALADGTFEANSVK